METQHEVLEYIRGRYEEEQERFNHIEQKSERILGLITFCLAALGGLATFNKVQLQFPTVFIDWIQFILLVLGFVCLVAAWGHALAVLKINECPVAPKSKTNADYIRLQSEEVAVKHMLDCYVDTTQQLEVVLEKKIRNLEFAYQELSYSVVLMLFYVIFSFV